jgi:predicted dehydrogenase
MAGEAMKNLNAAIIGAGFMGEVHAKSYVEMHDVNLKYIVDLNMEKGKRLADKFGCGHVRALEEILDSEIDIIDICLPTKLHKTIAIKCLEAGKHVICEKPVSLNWQDGVEIANIAKDLKRKFMVAHVVRFWPEYSKLSEMILTKEITNISTMTFSRYGPPPKWSEGGWIVTDAQSGGIIYDLIIHDIDFVLSVIGMPEWVFAKKTEKEGFTAYINAILGYGEINVLVEGGFIMPDTYPFTVGYRVNADNATFEYINKNKCGLFKYNQSQVQKIDYPDYDPYNKELEYFVHCIENDKEVEIGSGESAAAAVRLADLIDISANKKELIKVV